MMERTWWEWMGGESDFAVERLGDLLREGRVRSVEVQQDRVATAEYPVRADATETELVVVLDGLIHGWDMATATGQPYEPSDALVTEVEAFAEGALGPLRDGTTFAEPVDPPAGATPIERLAAFTGRRVD